MGVLPLGAFLFEHLYVATSALRGEEAFASSVAAVQSVPAFRVLGIVFIWIPLALHAAYGLYIIVRRKPHGPAYLYSTRVRVLMRVTAVIALAFILFHAALLRPASASGSLYTELAARLSTTTASIPLIALFYMLGITATVFHFAAGTWGAFVTWGWLPSSRAKAVGRVAFGVMGAGLMAAGALTVVCLATGTRFFKAGEFTELENRPPRALRTTRVAIGSGSGTGPPDMMLAPHDGDGPYRRRSDAG